MNRYLPGVLIALVGMLFLWTRVRQPTDIQAPSRVVEVSESGPRLHGNRQVEPAAPSNAPAPVQSATPAGGRPFQFAKPRRRHVAGRVVDESGKGVEGIGVFHREPTKGPLVDVSPLAYSDAEGNVAFWSAEPSLYLEAKLPPGWYCNDMAFVGGRVATFVFRVVPGHTIRGLVLGRDGRPMPRARVVFAWKGALDAALDTDAKGRFEQVVPAGASRIQAWVLVGLRTARTEIRPSAPLVEVTLRVEDGTTLRGRVTGPGDEPVNAGKVFVRSVGVPQIMHRGTALDAEGRFAIPHLEPGSYWVYCDPEADTLAVPAPLRVDVPGLDAHIVCPTGHIVYGRLVGEHTEGFRAAYVPAPFGGAPVRPHRTVDVGQQGNFRIPRVQPGQGLIYVWRWHPRDGRHAIVREPRAGGPIEISVREGPTIEGHVRLHDGRVPSGTSVRATLDGPWHWFPVEDDGSFRIKGLPPGSYSFAWHRGTSYGVFEQAPVEAGTKGVRLHLPR